MRICFFVFLLCLFLHSKEFTLYAPNITNKDGKLVSDDGVVLFSKGYFARAKSLSYDEKNGILILENDVFINNQNSYTNTKKAVIDVSKNSIDFKDFFLGNSEFEIWLKSKNAVYENDKVILYDSYVSSCEVDKPTWKIGFSVGEFDVRTKDLSLKHSLFYYQEVPIFYMPFFDINVENIRRSGLLVPDIGIATKDGLYYRQPIYFAPVRYLDLQFDPIIRTHRGYGLYNIFRFAGPNNIRLDLSGGFFKDFRKYTKDNELSNSEHKGIELEYTQDSLFFKDYLYEGLYIKGAYLNDVDYINLVSNKLKLDGNFVNSKFNYFASSDKNFYGVFARYYIDTSKESNVDTIQELPHLNYHKYTDSFLNNIFQYAINIDAKNFYRKELSSATLYKADVPLSINFSLFDNYLDIKLEEKLMASYASYNKYKTQEEYILASSTSLKLSSNLSNKFETFYHNISPEISFNLPGFLKGGYSEDYLYNYNEIRSIDFAFTQFFYNQNKNKKLEHFIRLSYFDDKNKFGVASHKIRYFFTPSTYIKDEVAYDLDKDRLQKHFLTLGIGIDDVFNTNIGYYYSHIDELENPKNENLVHSLSYIYKNRYKFFYSLEYDLKLSNLNQYLFGFTYRKKCINYTISYKQTIDPILSKDSDSRKQRGVYFMVNLYPLGGVTYDYALE